MATPSPEVTGDYKCPECSNTLLFTGIDVRGFGGRDACDCTDYDECVCSTELRQDFFVTEDGEVEYHAFTGGESGAEIGRYTSIKCRVCGAVVWQEDPEEVLV